MQEFFYQGIKRLDWGFGNPNITAGLIATLLMAVWGLAFIHRWGFWPALLGFTTLGVCLIQTVSRGGLVAAILGGFVIISCLRRPWLRDRWIPIVASLLILVSYALWQGVATRYGKGIVEEDGSVSNRWLIYRMAPAMMVDAPGGWGHKRASEAFHHFYQPEGHFERYGSLVSSHLTWMAEWSWWGRIGYVAGWLTVFVFCLPSAKRRWYGVSLAAWVAFGGAAMFTTMANRWVLWVVPSILFLCVLATRALLFDWPSWRRTIGIGFGTFAFLVGIVLWGSLIFPSRPTVELDSGWVRLAGVAGSAVWIAAPDPQVLGKLYGQHLRKQVLAKTYFVEWSPGELVPGESDSVVFSGEGIGGLYGERLTAAGRAKKWIFVNPNPPPQTLAEALDSSPPIRILWGEFHSGRARYQWDAIALEFEQIYLEEITTAGKYIPDWD
ncbi:MAG TPA: hypothetical protein PK648_14875 [Verrucomicrobiales bacterium]|nr:hypothetical protein [Verrucomicrobiales bacterium]